MEHSFRAAVFDLDGTLLDTLQDLGACADEALRQYGFPGHTMEEYRSYIGNGIPRLIARAVPEGTSEQDIQKVLNFYLGYYPVHCAEHTKLFPGVAQTIRLLRQRELRFCLRRNAGDPCMEHAVAQERQRDAPDVDLFHQHFAVKCKKRTCFCVLRNNS